jgi:hypothetical protein
MQKKKIRIKSIEGISLMSVEVNSYKYSKDIAEFNYDENNKILKKICTTIKNEIEISNILYVVSLIELLGSKYINMAIMLHKNNFIIKDNEFAYDIGKYIDYQSHTGSSYTIMIRNAAKIIEYKYYDILKIADNIKYEKELFYETQLQKNTKKLSDNINFGKELFMKCNCIP